MPQFSDLPPELRHNLWEAVLPEITEAIYIFNSEWALQFFPQRNQVRGVSPRPCLPARIHVPIPEIWMVCREARVVVEKLEWYFRHETQGHIIVREFDVQRDILFVPRDEWTPFWAYCLEMHDIDGMRRFRENLVNVASSAYTAFDSVSDIAPILENAPTIKKLFVVWNDLPQPHKIQYRVDDQDCESDAPVQPRWEIASYPKLGETVHMHRLDFNEGVDDWDKGVLRDWVVEMDRSWRMMVQNTDLADAYTGDLKVPRINVTMMEVPTWTYMA
ncbi:hypothetical protein NW762_001251 [Fusarium torreyae]|uniref:2EXR domain-containing protein n=1 Tax=Fusarium torreyae TaxID=1237075 RepID=A0A9W8VNS8_9HYPO|nr:hypothetical protein NW762_001251 [Fusarium torreyae]